MLKTEMNLERWQEAARQRMAFWSEMFGAAVTEEFKQYSLRRYWHWEYQATGRGVV